MRLLIRDATVITMDAASPVIEHGAVYVDGSRIAAVGATDTVAAQAPPDVEVVDAAGRILLPGFVSAHNHLGYTVFRGRAEDVGHSPTHRLYLPMNLIMQREERATFGALAVAELLRGGVTCVLEMEEDADVLAPFIERSGIRAAMGVMTHDVDLEALMRGETVFDADVRRAQLEQAFDFAGTWHGAAGGRISAVVTTNGLSTSSPELLRALREGADRLGVRLSIHLASGDMHLVLATHGKGTFQVAKEHGFLGEDVIAVHCYRIDEEGIGALADSGTHLAHCPLMNQFRGGIAPAEALRARGVNVGLGIDNYFSDFFDLIRACIASARIRADDPEVMPSADALAMATIDSARALGLEAEIGSIEVGKRADLALVDMRRFGLTPVTDPIGTLVYHAHAKDVDSVMVDGIWRVRGGELVDLDEEELVEDAARAGSSVWSRFHERFGGFTAEAGVR